MNISRLKCVAVLLMVLAVSLVAGDFGNRSFREGDVVFTGSPAGQGAAIMAATGSPFTHCGIVFRNAGEWMVLEAVQPVRTVTLAHFIAHANPATFAVKRLKAPLDPAAVQKARKWAEAQIGKNYDARFQWGDDKLYCSELVWKIYREAGIELCAPRHFTDYHLDDPQVKKLLDERYGGASHLPKDEKVVAPSDLAASPLLTAVD